MWDGEELLERAVECIRPIADYINIIWSDKSWYGEMGNKDVEKICNSLKERGLVDEVIKYDSDIIRKDDKDHRNKRRIEETKRRNFGLKAALDSGCDYFMAMDTMNVRRGSKLAIGEKIGTIGKTGKVSEPQLHFEIRKGTKAYNPRKELK